MTRVRPTLLNSLQNWMVNTIRQTTTSTWRRRGYRADARDLLQRLLHVELALPHHALDHEPEQKQGVQRAPHKLGGSHVLSASFKYSATASPAASSCVASSALPSYFFTAPADSPAPSSSSAFASLAATVERATEVQPRGWSAGGAWKDFAPALFKHRTRRRGRRLGTRSARRARARGRGGYLPLAWRASPCLACCGAPTPRLLLWHYSLSKGRSRTLGLSFRPVHASQKPKTVLPRGSSLARIFGEPIRGRLWEKNTRIPRHYVIVAAHNTDAPDERRYHEPRIARARRRYAPSSRSPRALDRRELSVFGTISPLRLFPRDKRR